MSEPGPEGMTEEQMRQLEAELERVHVDDVVLQTIVSLINLGARKGAVGAPPEAGLTPDYDQLKIAIDAAGALLAIVEPRHGDKVGPIRDAVSQLQLAYAQGTGGQAPPAPSQPGAPPQQPPAQPQGGQAGPGDAQRSGRLWVPGQ
jgi:hypothetical protein